MKYILYKRVRRRSIAHYLPHCATAHYDLRESFEWRPYRIRPRPIRAPTTWTEPENDPRHRARSQFIIIRRNT